MKNIRFAIAASLLPIFFLAMPVHRSSATIVPCALNDVSGGGDAGVCTLCHLIVGIYNIIGWIKSILVVITLAGITIGGVMYILSAGSPGMMQTAKKFITACVVGFALVLAAWLIVYLAMWLISARTDLGVGKTNWYTFDCSPATGKIEYSSDGSGSSTSTDASSGASSGGSSSGTSSSSSSSSANTCCVTYQNGDEKCIFSEASDCGNGVVFPLSCTRAKEIYNENKEEFENNYCNGGSNT